MIAAPAMAAGVRLVCGIVTQWRCDPDAAAQRIYFANHSSHLDFVVIWSALSPGLRAHVRPVAGRDYWERDVVRRYLARDMFRAVLIDRPATPKPSQTNGEGGSPPTVDPCASARAAVERMADAMGDRDSLILFPEGTRSTNGEIGQFKSGLYYLSRLRPDAELIPVHVENLNRILPKGEVLPVPMISRVVFGPSVSCAAEDKQDFLDAARDALLQLGRNS
jgi:1-acyl-sn-glycerol-3-phosphate acyltransferase